MAPQINKKNCSRDVSPSTCNKYIDSRAIQWIFQRCIYGGLRWNFEIFVSFARLIFSDMHLRNKWIKHSPTWSYNHTCFLFQTLIKNPFIRNPYFHSKSSILCFITSKGAKKVWIPGKDHLFQSSLLTLILFFGWKTCVYFRDTFSESVWTQLKMNL